MSNKQQLQTNNTNLASYTDRVSALIGVANALPEAGGSGSGGAVETCTMTVTDETGYSGNGLILTHIFNETRGDFFCATSLDNYVSYDALYNNLNTHIVKGSVVFFTASSVYDKFSFDITGDATLLVNTTMIEVETHIYAIKIEGDCSITVKNA